MDQMLTQNFAGPTRYLPLQMSPEYIVPLFQRFHAKRWEKFNSEKVCHISYARIQGKNSLVAHFQNSSLLHEDKRCRPILFHSGGPLAGDQEPFPVGPNARARPARGAAGQLLGGIGAPGPTGAGQGGLGAGGLLPGAMGLAATALGPQGGVGELGALGGGALKSQPGMPNLGSGTYY